MIRSYSIILFVLLILLLQTLPGATLNETVNSTISHTVVCTITANIPPRSEETLALALEYLNDFNMTKEMKLQWLAAHYFNVTGDSAVIFNETAYYPWERENTSPAIPTLNVTE